MTRSIIIAPDEFYHVYNRGVEKRKVFLSRTDYDRFVALLYLANQTEPADLKYQGKSFSEITENRAGEPLVAIVAYCMMPNHFHLLLREVIDGGVARFMQKLTTGYTMYFNKRNERRGALFEGTYKAKHAEEDRYLRYLISYIHLNPVKLLDREWKTNGIRDRDGAERFLEKYEYSSYLDYFYFDKIRPQKKIIEQEIGLELFESSGDFKQCTTEWLTYSTEQNKV